MTVLDSDRELSDAIDEPRREPADLVVRATVVIAVSADDPVTIARIRTVSEPAPTDRSPVTSACLYPVGKPAGAGRTQHDGSLGRRNRADASAVPPGNHRLLRAARNEPLVALSNVPARWL